MNPTIFGGYRSGVSQSGSYITHEPPSKVPTFQFGLLGLRSSWVWPVQHPLDAERGLLGSLGLGLLVLPVHIYIYALCYTYTHMYVRVHLHIHLPIYRYMNLISIYQMLSVCLSVRPSALPAGLPASVFMPAAHTSSHTLNPNLCDLRRPQSPTSAG